MKFKKSVAAIAAAAMVMSTMALTPVSVYAAPVSVGTTISGSYTTKKPEDTPTISVDFVNSWGTARKTSDYTKFVVNYTVTDVGNAKTIGFCVNGGTCGWTGSYAEVAVGDSQTLEINVSELSGDTFEWLGVQIIPADGTANNTDVTAGITINSYELVEVPKDPMIDFGSSSGDWAQGNFVTNESPEMVDADLTGVTKAIFRARVDDLNWGWNNGKFFAQPYKGVGADGKDEGDWKDVSFGGVNEQYTYDVTLSNTGDFEVEVPFNVIDTNKFYQLGWGTGVAEGAFKLYGIDFYKGSTKIGTWSVTGTWDGPKKAAVSDVVPNKVVIGSDKTTELVGTSVPLTATITSESGDPISVDYTVDWTVDPAEGATVSGDKTSATLSATKAGEYTVTCTVKAEDGTTYATNTIKVTFTEAIVDADKVIVDAKPSTAVLGKEVALEAAVSSTSGKPVTGKYTLDWTVSGEGATVTASEEKDTVVLSATKAGKYTVTCVVKNGEGKELAKSTADVTFTEPVKPDTVKVTADKETVTEGTPVKFTAAISNSKEEKIDAEYVVEWSVSPDKGAKLNSKENTASLNASEAGEYTVTCTVKSADGKETYATATAKVTVKAAENPFDLKVEKEELVVGETTTASASRNGEAISVKWKSSDEKIATVDENGVITAVAKGTVDITATPEDGSPKTVEITVIEATKEYKVEKFVDRLYNTLLGRNPDEHSADHKNDLLADKTACEVARNFVLSDEFLNKGLTNEEVVDKMYMTFLGRPADEAGKADWVNRLNNGCSYAHVFYGFTQCKEFAEICADYGIEVGTYKVESPRDVNCNLTAFVSRLYGKVLGRTYDVPGLDNHTAKYLEKGDIYAMAYDFIFSPEFVEKELSDEEFVEVMYNTFFNRASDPEGKANWLKLLADGGSREDVLKGFVGSNECAELVESFKI